MRIHYNKNTPYTKTGLPQYRMLKNVVRRLTSLEGQILALQHFNKLITKLGQDNTEILAKYIDILYETTKLNDILRNFGVTKDNFRQITANLVSNVLDNKAAEELNHIFEDILKADVNHKTKQLFLEAMCRMLPLLIEVAQNLASRKSKGDLNTSIIQHSHA